MKKRAPVLCFHLVLLAVFLTIPAAFAHPNQPLIIDFRPVAPVEKMSLSLPFTLPVATAEVVRFEGTGLCAVKTGHRLPMDRLTFTVDQTTEPGGKLTVFQLRIQLLPSDPPGAYEGLVYAVCPDAKERPPLPILVKVRVLPWIRLEPATVDPLLTILDTPFFTEDFLPARAPVKLLLASNAPWRLSLRVGSRTPFRPPPFPLQISIGKTLNTTDFKAKIMPSGEFYPVAFGAPTVVGEGARATDYWTELYVTVSIPNWYHYPAGDYDFRLFLTAETLGP